jgi:hypothetical protein
MFCVPRRGMRQLCALALTACGLAIVAFVVSSPIAAASPDTAPALPAPTGAVVSVSNVTQLYQAFDNLEAGQTILIAPGTYQLTRTLYVNGRGNVTIRGATNNRNDVTLVGTGMTVPSDNLKFAIWTGQGAPNVMIANLTIRDVYQHPIIINAGTAAPRIYNVRLVNAGQQFLKSNPDANGVGTNNGVVEYSVFEYDTTAPSYYTNAVDVHGGANWIIRNNLFRRIRAPQGELAGPAILMWRGSSNSVVEGNTFIDCQRDIALGFEEGSSHSGGIIRNNFIYRSAGFPGDAPISVYGSANTKVVHNTILLNGSYPTSIETRWATSNGVQLVNNLADRAPQARDGSQFTQNGNIWTASAGLFANPGIGDLHLVATASAAIDHGVSTNDAPNDWDGEARNGGRDVGADEYFAFAPPPPPPPPSVEICGNGIDDDADGQIDEGCSSPPPPPPPAEVCGDGIDNDNDGLVDEGCAPPLASSAPGAPSRLVGNVRGSTVLLSWLAPIVGTPAAAYLIEAGLTPGQTLLSVPVGATSLTVPNVGPGRFYLRVRAQNAAGSSEVSNEVAVTVGCSGPSSAPQAFTSASSGQLVSLGWKDPDGCSGSSYVMVAGSQPGALDLGAVPLPNSGVTLAAPAGVYYGRVATRSDYGISSLSNEVAITVGSNACQPPSFAIALTSSVNGPLVTLGWHPVSSAAALASDAVAPIAYVLEAGTAPGAAQFSAVVGRTTALTIPVPPGEYYVRIRAQNVCGAGPASSDALVRVL